MTDVYRQRLIALWRCWELAYRPPPSYRWVGYECFREFFIRYRIELARRVLDGDPESLGRDAAAVRRFVAAGADLRTGAQGHDHMASHRTAILTDLDELIHQLHAEGLEDVDAVVTFSPEGFITQWDHGAEHLFGWTAAEAIGRAVGETLEGDAERRARSLIVHRQGHWEGIVVVAGKSGRAIATESRTLAERDDVGRIVGFRVTYREAPEPEWFKLAMRAIGLR